MSQATPAARDGFTLLEMVLALALLAAGTLGIMDLLHRAQASTAEGDNTLIAGFLAQRCQEQIRRLAYANLSTTNANSACTVPSAFSSQFTRTITVTPQTSTSPYNTSDLTRVDVQLSWTASGGTANVTLSTLRANN
jgi:prepilin-type N-terminal cleavage/methylation domain-containing protein